MSLFEIRYMLALVGYMGSVCMIGFVIVGLLSVSDDTSSDIYFYQKLFIAVIFLLVYMLNQDAYTGFKQFRSGEINYDKTFVLALEKGGEYEIKGTFYSANTNSLYYVSENGAKSSICPQIKFDGVEAEWSNINFSDQWTFSEKTEIKDGSANTFYCIPNGTEGILHCTIEDGEIVSGEFSPNSDNETDTSDSESDTIVIPFFIYS